MEARMKNPAFVLNDVMPHMLAITKVVNSSGLPHELLELIHLRVSQINSCAVCIDMGFRNGEKNGETHERLFTVAAWRHAPYFSDAERAALALAECVTRMADRDNAVPDAVWAEAARHFDEKSLAALLVHMSLVNVWNRLNNATAQVAGAWKP